MIITFRESFRKDLVKISDSLLLRRVRELILSIEKAKEVAAELSFPVGYGVTRAIADQLGSWWEERRGIIQPSEFLVTAEGKIRSATYSSGPIGRVDAADVITLVAFYDKLAAREK